MGSGRSSLCGGLPRASFHTQSIMIVGRAATRHLRATALRLRSTLSMPPLAASSSVQQKMPPLTSDTKSMTTAKTNATHHLDCSNTKSAFAGTSSMELLRGAAVLTACAQPWLVRHAESALVLMNKFLGETVTAALLRRTIYAHFVAGEDAVAIVPKLKALYALGVGGILDYAAEADLANQEVSYDAHAAAPGVNQPSRVWPYLNEAVCDANLAIFLSAVDAVKATTPEGFAAVKVTALGDPALLERVSTAVVELRTFFERMDRSGSGSAGTGVGSSSSGNSSSGVLTRADFLRGWVDAFDVTEDEAAAIFDEIDHQRTEEEDRLDLSGVGQRRQAGEVDILECTNALTLSQIGPLVQRCRHKGPLYHSALDEDECQALQRLLDRLDQVAARARSLEVRLMVDAEHTYFQPAIDHAVLRLSRTHNRDYPCVFGTYQCYLTGTRPRLALDLDRAKREGWHLGAKLVRGAYMVHERERAKARGYPDPIHPTAEETHMSYDAAIDALLLHCPCPERTSVMVATHNRQSVERAAAYLLRGGGNVGNGGDGDGGDGGDGRVAGDVSMMGASGGAGAAQPQVGGGEGDGRDDAAVKGGAQMISRVPAENVSFGQLLGMADHLTFTLASHGLKAYKYVPYGPVKEVLPYLIRRAHENADALGGAVEQRDMMLEEVRRRLVGR